jgi:predicted ABC-type ATPase
MIAGPNGSGKSSLTTAYKSRNPDFPTLYINAADLKKQHNLTDEQAQNKADDMRQAALSRLESFAFETVMSHPSKIDVLREAKEQGYETRMLFMTTQDPQINKLRVLQRLAEGGHNVPQDKIAPRYNRSMALMPLALVYSDRAEVYNNSFERPVLIHEKAPGKEKKHPQPPPSYWSNAAITQHITASKKAIIDYAVHVAEKKNEMAKGPER